MSYVIYQHNYRYLDGHLDIDYEKTGEVTPIATFATREEAEQALIREVCNFDIPIEGREEWKELSQDTIKNLQKYLEAIDLNPPISKKNGKLTFEVWNLDFDKLTDEQYLELLSLADAQTHYIEESYDVSIHTVIYTEAEGYLFEDPYGYSDDLRYFYSFDQFEETVTEYTGWSGYEPLWSDEIDLTQNDLKRDELWALTEQYADHIDLKINEQKTSGKITFLDTQKTDYKMRSDFNNVIDNPTFIIHDATDEDLMKINNKEGAEVIKKYKYQGLKQG